MSPDFPAPTAPVRELEALPRRRPSTTDPDLFASRFTSDGPNADLRAIAGNSEPSTSHDEYRRQVGRRARLARIGLGLSQDEIAARTPDLTRNFVSAIERGAQGLDAWRLRQLAAALGVSPSWLLDLT